MTIYRITTVNRSDQVVISKKGYVVAASGKIVEMLGWKLQKVRQHCVDQGWALSKEIGDDVHFTDSLE